MKYVQYLTPEYPPRIENFNRTKFPGESTPNIEERFEEIFGDSSNSIKEKSLRQREFLKKNGNLKRRIK